MHIDPLRPVLASGPRAAAGEVPAPALTGEAVTLGASTAVSKPAPTPAQCHEQLARQVGGSGTFSLQTVRGALEHLQASPPEEQGLRLLWLTAGRLDWRHRNPSDFYETPEVGRQCRDLCVDQLERWWAEGRLEVYREDRRLEPGRVRLNAFLGKKVPFYGARMELPPTREYPAEVQPHLARVLSEPDCRRVFPLDKARKQLPPQQMSELMRALVDNAQGEEGLPLARWLASEGRFDYRDLLRPELPRLLNSTSRARACGESLVNPRRVDLYKALQAAYPEHFTSELVASELLPLLASRDYQTTSETSNLISTILKGKPEMVGPNLLESWVFPLARRDREAAADLGRSLLTLDRKLAEPLGAWLTGPEAPKTYVLGELCALGDCIRKHGFTPDDAARRRLAERVAAYPLQTTNWKGETLPLSLWDDAGQEVRSLIHDLGSLPRSLGVGALPVPDGQGGTAPLGRVLLERFLEDPRVNLPRDLGAGGWGNYSYEVATAMLNLAFPDLELSSRLLDAVEAGLAGVKTLGELDRRTAAELAVLCNIQWEPAEQERLARMLDPFLRVRQEEPFNLLVQRVRTVRYLDARKGLHAASPQVQLQSALDAAAYRQPASDQEKRQRDGKELEEGLDFACRLHPAFLDHCLEELPRRLPGAGQRLEACHEPALEVAAFLSATRPELSRAVRAQLWTGLLSEPSLSPDGLAALNRLRLDEVRDHQEALSRGAGSPWQRGHLAWTAVQAARLAYDVQAGQQVESTWRESLQASVGERGVLEALDAAFSDPATAIQFYACAVADDPAPARVLPRVMMLRPLLGVDPDVNRVRDFFEAVVAADADPPAALAAVKTLAGAVGIRAVEVCKSLLAGPTAPDAAATQVARIHGFTEDLEAALAVHGAVEARVARGADREVALRAALIHCAKGMKSSLLRGALDKALSNQGVRMEEDHVQVGPVRLRTRRRGADQRGS